MLKVYMLNFSFSIIMHHKRNSSCYDPAYVDEDKQKLYHAQRKTGRMLKVTLMINLL